MYLRKNFPKLRNLDEDEIQKLYHHLMKEHAEMVARKEEEILQKEFYGGEIHEPSYTYIGGGGSLDMNKVMRRKRRDGDWEPLVHSRKNKKSHSRNKDMDYELDFLSMEGDEEYLGRHGGRKLWTMVAGGVKVISGSSSSLGSENEKGCS